MEHRRVDHAPHVPVLHDEALRVLRAQRLGVLFACQDVCFTIGTSSAGGANSTGEQGAAALLVDPLFWMPVYTGTCRDHVYTQQQNCIQLDKLLVGSLGARWTQTAAQTSSARSRRCRSMCGPATQAVRRMTAMPRKFWLVCADLTRSCKAMSVTRQSSDMRKSYNG